MYFAFQCDDPEPSRHQDVDHAPRQHLVRRLGRPQPRRARHRPDLLSPDGESERRPARHAEQRRRAARISRRTTSGTAPGRLNQPATPSRCVCRCRPSGSAAAQTCGWAILFWRRVSRVGVSVAWPALEPGKWVFEKHAVAVVQRAAAAAAARGHSVDDLLAQRSRATRPTRWGSADDDGEFGLSAKYGITSTITLDATVNPDFSQVESDAFQVEVNQRFPIFFSEKRPFFMEGAGIFTLAGRGQRQQPAARRPHAPHRRSDLRREADRQRRAPDVRHADRARPGRRPQPAGRAIRTPARIGCSTSRARNTASGRATTSARSSSTPSSPAGSTASIGADLSWRVNSTQRVSGFVLGVATRAPHDGGRRNRASARRPATSTARGGSCWSATASTTTATSRWRRRSSTASASRAAGATRIQLLSRQDEVSMAPAHLAVLVHPGRPRSQSPAATSCLQVPGVRLQLHAPGLPARRSLRRVRDLGRPAVRPRQLAHAGQRAAVSLAVARRAASCPARAVFYDPDDPFQGRSRDTPRRAHAAAERPVLAGAVVPPRRVRSRVRPASASTISTSSTAGPRISSRASSSSARIAQYDSSRYRVLTDFLVVVRAAPRHGRLRGLRIADRAARLRQRRVGARPRRLQDQPARAVLQGVVPAPILVTCNVLRARVRCAHVRTIRAYVHTCRRAERAYVPTWRPARAHISTWHWKHIRHVRT